MEINLDLVLKIVSAILASLATFLLKKYFGKKAKVVSYLLHTSAINLRDSNNTQVNSHSIVVRNVGNETAHNIRIGHNFLPASYQIQPPVSHQIIGVTDGVGEILIPTLVAQEQISISYLYFPPKNLISINSYTKSDEGMAKIINVIPTPQPSKIAIFGIWALMLIGLGTLIYILLSLLLKYVVIS